jgi:RNA-directed DNA polymerase
MAPAFMPRDEWKTIPWKRCDQAVFKLQQRIYRAARRGDTKAVHHLQRLLVRSRAARLLAVRRVTQDNRGKRTAGVDGVKHLNPAGRLRLARTLRLPTRAAPLRRVWIPKPGRDERRPLGIPTMSDRAAQALAKLALEPAWEARFEPNSYGFRPGRSAHDAIEAIFNAIRSKPKYVLDADITKCFDRIDQAALLARMGTFPTMARAIRAWLTAGVMEGRALVPTAAGTPQGGVVSPLLANIALHGLETALRAAIPGTRQHEGWRPLVIRYADDFVVLHQDLEVIHELRRRAEAWLGEIGLELNPTKTRIGHTLHDHAGQRAGFDFLGFQIRQYAVGRTHSGTKRSGHRPAIRLGYKTLTRPSVDAMRRHHQEMKAIIQHSGAMPTAALIQRLTPVIRGWTRYYRSAAAKQSFAKQDNHTYQLLWRWAYRRHPQKSGHWRAHHYWGCDQGPWTFAASTGQALPRHTATPIQRHIKVRGDRSPFDGDWAYWGSRLGRHPLLSARSAHLLQRQRGRCAACGLHFCDGDRLEVDHITPTASGGRDVPGNWQLLHGHCHDAKTAADRQSAASGTLDTSRCVEEPDEVKVSRPVLEPSGAGDRAA